MVCSMLASTRSAHAGWCRDACFALHRPVDFCEGERRRKVEPPGQQMRAGARMAMRTRGVRMEALQRCVPPAGVLLHTLALLACNPLGAHQPRQLSAASRRASVRMIGHGVLPGSKTAPSLWGGVPYRSYTATSSRLVLWGGGGGGDRGKREEFSVCALCFNVMRPCPCALPARTPAFSLSAFRSRPSLMSVSTLDFLIIPGRGHRRCWQECRSRSSHG